MDISIRREIRDALQEALLLLEAGEAREALPLRWRERAGAAAQRITALQEAVRANVAAGENFYFGALGAGEHRLYDGRLAPVPGWPRRNVTELPEQVFRSLDGGLLPDTEAEGRARVQVIDGWTVLAFPDRSADRRRNSHSTFVMRGEHAGVLAVATARLLFPGVFSRFTFPVEVET